MPRNAPHPNPDTSHEAIPIHTQSQHQQTQTHPLWLRISAFLSLKSPLTATTYSGIITEWCAFLGVKVGSNSAAIKIITATDLHAIAYRKFLETQPGEQPRLMRADKNTRSDHSSQPAAPPTVNQQNSRHAHKKKRDGTESTQSNATIYKKFAALRRIYRMLIASNLGVTENPFDVDRVPPPAKDAGRKRPTQMVDFDLVMEIIDTPDTKTPKGRRDRAILATLFGGGIRRSELVSLRIGDVRKTAANTTFLYLRHTKAKRDAEQAIPNWAADPLWELVAERKGEGAASSDHLFVSYQGRAGSRPTGKAISDTGVYLLFKHYCMAAGAGSFATPHSARATAITKLLSDGIPHREVQEFSRHASVQMVEWYDKRRFDIEESPARGLDYKRR